MYDHTLHSGKKYRKKILKSHINNCFKINSKQMIQMPKEGEQVKFKNMKKKNNITIYDLCRF